jgi:hypothetical protein
MDKLEHYLDQVCRGIGGPRALRQHVRQELREHLRDAAAEYKAAGLPEEQALDRALEDFGGPEEVRSGLEATHGHRLLRVVIDKAMQWQERTMKAKWLWTTWAYLVVAGIVVMNVLYFTFCEVLLVPKLQQLRQDGWIQTDASDEPAVGRLDSFLRCLHWVGDHATWCLLAAIGAWGLFEWRVRGENKPFIRLSALGTVGLALTFGAAVVGAALVIPFMLGMPAMVRISQPFAAEQMAVIDTSVGAIEQALAKKDWDAIRGDTDRAEQAVNRLSAVAGAIEHGPANQRPTVDELRARLQSAGHCLAEVRLWAGEKDERRLEAAVKKFRELYGPIREAARAEK